MIFRHTFTVTAGLAFAAVGVVQAQEPADVIVHKEVRVMPGMAYEAASGPVSMDFVGSEMSFSGNPVKGAPYSAEAVTETVQALSDGNRITHKSTATVYRDSQGRTRREETIAAIGPWAASGEPHQIILINDPAASVSYHLDPQTHSAYKIPMGKGVFFFGNVNAAGAAGASDRVFTFNTRVPPPGSAEGGSGGIAVAAAPRARAGKTAHSDVKTESLGKQMIEGVQAEGTHSTMTIPAGDIGNELPIASVSERWYSPELQTVVMSKRSDPRFGETTYHLMNLQRGEQPATLFEVPSDYTIKEGPPMRKAIRAHQAAEEAK
jgi:hypothetical protein